MVKKITVFQCLATIVLLESFFLLLRSYTNTINEVRRNFPASVPAPSTLVPAPSTVLPAPSTVLPPPSTVPPAPSTLAPTLSCDRCRINVSIDASEVDIISSKWNKEALSAGTKQSEMTLLSPRKDIMYELKDIKRSVKNVFFIESSCGTKKLTRVLDKDSKYLLSARQSCAVESTARNNPGRDMYIVHTCPLSDDFLSKAPEYARRLLELQNVHIVKFDLSELVTDSPVQQLFESGRLDDSRWPVVHASDVIRVLLLWRFGGTYIDLDFINIRPLEKLGTNYAGNQDNFINNGFLNVEPSGFGHSVFTKLLEHLETHFNGTEWPINGPIALHRVLFEVCKVPVIEKSDCSVFTVYDKSILYPIFYEQVMRLFLTSWSAHLIKSFKETAFGVHFWNLQSKTMKVKVGAKHAYGLIADEFCPSVYRNCGPIF